MRDGKAWGDRSAPWCHRMATTLLRGLWYAKLSLAVGSPVEGSRLIA